MVMPFDTTGTLRRKNEGLPSGSAWLLGDATVP